MATIGQKRTLLAVEHRTVAVSRTRTAETNCIPRAITASHGVEAIIALTSRKIVRIKSIIEAALDRAQECQTEVGERFKKSVGIAYGYNEKKQFIAYGSCTFLEVAGQKYIVTAAHVIDAARDFGFAVTGSSGLIQIVDDFLVTMKVDGCRVKDKHDFAFQRLSDQAIVGLGDAVEFIEAHQVSQNRGTMRGRQYLVVGYPASQNTRLIDRKSKRLRPQPWSYRGAAVAEMDAGLSQRTGLKQETNLAISFNDEEVGDYTGVPVEPPKVKGVSGGALIDLGLPHPDRLASTTECIGRLAGIVIEGHKAEQLLAAVRIEHVLSAIRASERRVNP